MRQLAVTLGRREFIYIPLLLLSTGLLFAKNLVYAKLLPVAGFGAFNEAILVGSTFANFGGAGLQLLAHKVLPRNYARGELDAVTDLLGSALGVFGIASTVMAAAIGVAVAGGFVKAATWWYAALLYSAAQYAFVLRLIDLKSDLRFVNHAMLSAIRAILLMACGIGVALLTRSVPGVVAIEALVTLLLSRPICAHVRGKDVGRKALRLWSDHAWLSSNLAGALHLLWLNSTMMLLYALDRWSGLVLLTEHEFGILALGLMALVAFETAQTIINVSAYPIMGRMISRGQHKRAFGLATLATAVIVGLSAICYFPFIWLFDYLVHRYLTAYVEAAPVVKVVVLAGTLRLADFYGSFAVLCNREKILARTFGVTVIVTAGLIAFLHLGAGVRFNPMRLTMVTLAVSTMGFAGNAIVAFIANRSMLVEKLA
jgi:O-antigen/teichoic acid export membrane protein